jgi:phosphoadenosine phosphosulfate reductase
MIDLFGRDIVKVSIDRLRMFEPSEGYYLAFSGGKDSVVIKALAIMSGVKFDAHYSVTTIDPPELIYFIRAHHSDVIWDRPTKPFLVRLVEKGFPLRQRRWCCAEFKETGGSNRVVVTGIRADESQKRAGRKMVETCYKDKTKKYLNVIIDWSESDIWEFIRQNKLPYCKLYDEGFKRIGCCMCPMSSNRLKESLRYPGMTKAFQNAFIKLYEKNKDRQSYRRWNSGVDMFRWWLNENTIKNIPDQAVMFE